MEDFRILLFFYLMQSYLMVLTGLNFFNIKLKNKETAQIVLIYGLFVWLVRGAYSHFNIPFGTHTIILVVLLCCIIKIITKIDLNYAMGITLISVCLVMLGSALVSIAINLSPFSLEEIFSNVWLHILFGHVENFFLLLYLVLTKFLKFRFDW